MPSLTQTKTLPYSSRSIYQLVMDIEKYPEFLPWCKQAKIIRPLSKPAFSEELEGGSNRRSDGVLNIHRASRIEPTEQLPLKVGFGTRSIERISEENLRADLLINFKNFFEKYRSDVKHGKNENGFFVDVVAIDGPFKNLVNKWQISDVENGKSCEVKFFIEFEFNSKFLAKMLGGIFAKATEKMMVAFEERAKELASNRK